MKKYILKNLDNLTEVHYRRVQRRVNYLIHVFIRSQCINQMKELKEQCEERIDELTKKSGDVPQIKENKDLTEDRQVWFG